MAGETRRTDPRSFIVRAAMMLVRAGVPLVIASATILRGDETGGVVRFAVPLLVALVLFNLAIAYLQWVKLTYAAGENDVRVESGVLARAARSVPYERIQDVSLEQKLLPRLFGLVEVKFETGAGGKDDLSLAYLSNAEGERLREVVRTRRDGFTEAHQGDDVQPAPSADLLFAMEPNRIFVFGLFEFSLAAVAVLAGVAQQFEFLLTFDLWDVAEWEQRLAGPGQWLSGLGPLAKAVGIVIAVTGLVFIGIVTGVVRTTLREWNFRLERTAKGLRRRRGLLTRTDLVMPLHRVQALRIRTGFLRRRFGWHSLSIISLASDSGNANHDAVPFGQMAEIGPVVEVAGFHLPDADLDWARAAIRYRIDQAVLVSGLLVLAAIAAAILAQNWLWLASLCVLPIIIARQWWRWKHDFRALGGRQLYNRAGWLSPKLSIASRTRLQSVEIAQGPVARWRNYASLHLGLAGGKLSIHGIPVDEARLWREQICASIAKTDFSELLESEELVAD